MKSGLESLKKRGLIEEKDQKEIDIKTQQGDHRLVLEFSSFHWQVFVLRDLL